MASYFDLDSSYRKVDTYPNPAKYVVEGDQISAWDRAPRQVTSNSNRQKIRTLEFAESAEVKALILPYINFTYTKKDGSIMNGHTADLQRVYLDVHSIRFPDMRLISTIGSVITNARFVLTRDKIQYDSNNNPVWVLFETKMDQVIRFARNEPLQVDIMQEEGYTIVIPDQNPIVKANQTYISLEITPYMIDGNYTNNDTQFTQF